MADPASKPKTVSVLLATHNGSRYIGRVLDGYARQTYPREYWRLIVVNNGSTDDTSFLLEQATHKLPMTVVEESRPGKNRSLNKGLSYLADEQFIVFTDDDAIPRPDMLEAWVRAFQDHPEFDVMGGSIAPLFETPPPPVIANAGWRFEELYARRQDLPAGRVKEDAIFGPNMAVRRAVLNVLTFREDVGPNAGVAMYPMGSETTFCADAAAAGFQLGFVPAPMVQHIVRPHQVGIDFIMARARRLGLGCGYRDYVSGAAPRSPRTLIWKLARYFLSLKDWDLFFRSHFADQLGRLDASWQREFVSGYRDGLDRLQREGSTRAKQTTTQ